MMLEKVKYLVVGVMMYVGLMKGQENILKINFSGKNFLMNDSFELFSVYFYRVDIDLSSTVTPLLFIETKYPLKSGELYELSFEMKFDYKASEYKAKQVGIKFINVWELNDIKRRMYGENYFVPTITRTDKFLILETGDTIWIKKSITYEARGGEKYVVLGLMVDTIDWKLQKMILKLISLKQGYVNSSLGERRFKKNFLKFNRLMVSLYLERNPYRCVFDESSYSDEPFSRFFIRSIRLYEKNKP